jgi:hypothetical protein
VGDGRGCFPVFLFCLVIALVLFLIAVVTVNPR